MSKHLAALIVLTALSACGGTGTPVIFTPPGGGTPPVLPGPATYAGDAGTVNLAQGGGYTFSLPFNGASVETVATLAPSPAPTAPLLSGNATLNGRYDLVRMTDFAVVAGVPSGTREQITGPLTLNVDFNTNAVTTPAGSTLAINGTYAPVVSGTTTFQQLTGAATYLGVAGGINGIVGADQAFGVFRGSGGTTAYAGGFTVVE